MCLIYMGDGEELPKEMEKLAISSLSDDDNNNVTKFGKRSEDDSCIGARRVLDNASTSLYQDNFRRKSDTALHNLKWPKLTAAQRFYQGRHTVGGILKSPTKRAYGIAAQRLTMREPNLQARFNRYNHFHKRIMTPYPIMNIPAINAIDFGANGGNGASGNSLNQIMEHGDITQRFKHLNLNSNRTDTANDKDIGHITLTGVQNFRKTMTAMPKFIRSTLTSIEENAELEITEENNNEQSNQNANLYPNLYTNPNTNQNPNLNPNLNLNLNLNQNSELINWNGNVFHGQNDVHLK